MDVIEYHERLRLANHLTEPAIRQSMRELALPAGSVGLDAGCGIGQHTLWLAEAAGPGSAVTGLDVDTGNLAAASRLAAQNPLGERVRFVQGDLLSLPFRDGSFAWVWCADTLWPLLVSRDPVADVRELARVVRPGGKIALVYWSGQSLLPGHPALEARLNSAFAMTVPYLADVPSRLHFLRALGWLAEAGLARPTARTLVAEAQAPLSPGLRAAVAHCFSMLWGNLESHVSREEWEAYRRLCDPGSGHFVLDRPDYYGFVTYTLFYGRVPS